MAKIKLNGDTSGYIEISAPAVSGNNTLELGPGTRILTNLDNTFTGVSTFSNGIDVTGGNVDIGGATHSRNLTVHDATNSVILIEGASNGTSNLMFGDENDEDVGMLGYNHASNYLAFTVNAAERLRITSGGNITYGNQSTSTGNSSSALVHISAGKEYWNGTAGDYRALKHRIYDNNIDDVYGMGVSSALLEIQSQSNIGFFAGGAGSGTGRRNERLRITSGGVVQIGSGTEATGAYQTVEMFVGATDENYSVIRGKYNRTNEYNRSEVRFGVESNAAGKGFLAFATGNNSAIERLRITSGGQIGIGTNAPTTGNPSGAKYLHIHNSSTSNSNSPSEIYFTNANTGPSGGAGGMITFYDTGFYFWNYADDDLHFGTGGSERFKFDHSLNALDFQSTSKIRLRGAAATGTTHAHLNIGSQGAANTDTRAIDIWGSWGDQESKSITWNHGTGTSDMVCQQRVRYNTTPSTTVYEIGRFYNGNNTTAFPFKLQSTGTTTADLTIDGQIYNRNQSFVAYSTQTNNIQSSTKIDYTVSSSYANVFNNSNSRFTAQRAGLYLFYVRHWFVANQAGTVYLDMMKNGNSAKEFRVTHPTASSEYETIQGTALVYMAVNDYMEVNGSAAGGAYLHESAGTRHSEFSGFYVSG